MITQFIEVSNGFNHGKFMVGRLDADELALRTAMPGYDEPLVSFAGRRAFDDQTTLVLDLQTGEGACFALRGSATADLEKHRIWVCPMFEVFLMWLYGQGLGDGAGDIKALPRYVELDAPGAIYGHRREGGG